MDKISVIIPVYKVEKYLSQCLKSVVNQTFKNIEILLVDDGSPDACPMMCDKWEKQDNRIKVIHKENGGLMSAWIEGFKQSTGDYIAFVDSDDFVKEEFLEKLYNALEENCADISVCNYSKTYDDGKVDEIKQILETGLLIKGENITNCIYAYAGIGNTFLAPCRWNKLFKRKIVAESLKYLNPEISMGEDLNMTFYAMTTATKVALIPEYLYFYRQVSTSISNTKRNNWSHYKKVLKQLLTIDKENSLGLKDFIYKWYVSTYIKECVCYVAKNCNKKQIKEFLNDEDLQYFVNTMPIDNFKKRVYYWGLKHKNIFLVKLAAKLIK